MDSSNETVKAPHRVCLLMAGGAGKRLWPSSRLLNPKPLLPLSSGRSLINETVSLLSRRARDITVLVGAAQEAAFRSHIDSSVSARVEIAAEPLSRNTAPAIALGIMRAMPDIEEDEDIIFIVSPSDHHVGDKDGFLKAVETAVAAAEKGFIVTIGIKPNRPETGYGYIQKGDAAEGAPQGVFKIGRFVEKPDLRTARRYVKQSFLWNSGIFVFRGRVMLEEIKKHAPGVFSAVRRSLSKEDSYGADTASYAKSPNISIDFAVMEKTELGAVVPASFEWDDVGSWESVYKLAKKDSDGNAVSGGAVVLNSKNCLVRSSGERVVAAEGLKGLVIVDEGDAVLVSDMKRAGKVKDVVDEVVARGGGSEASRPLRTERAWGSERMIEKGGGFSVRSVHVSAKMDYQPQANASRVVVLEGEAVAILGGKSVTLAEGDLLEAPDGVPLRVKNGGKLPLRLLEISFNEDG
ncbi:MAG: mannose-1-phosphate guanylyltransferase [Thermodesulfobacteriota bacterium]